MPAPKEPVRATRTDERPDEFMNGIPNRDLTEADWGLLGDDQKATVIESGLWKIKTDEQMAPMIARVEKAAEKATEHTAKAAVAEKTDGGAD
jgi:hypothetical protein